MVQRRRGHCADLLAGTCRVARPCECLGCATVCARAVADAVEPFFYHGCHSESVGCGCIRCGGSSASFPLARLAFVCCMCGSGKRHTHHHDFAGNYRLGGVGTSAIAMVVAFIGHGVICGRRRCATAVDCRSNVVAEWMVRATVVGRYRRSRTHCCRRC